MSLLQSIKWMKRPSTASALLAVLIFLCLAAHFLAVGRITMLSGVPHDSWPPRFLRNITGIQFFHANWWFALPYLLLFFGTLIYMDVRRMPGSVVWSTFAFMSLPLLGYIVTCMNVGIWHILVMGPIHGQ